MDSVGHRESLELTVTGKKPLEDFKCQSHLTRFACGADIGTIIMYL